MWHGILVVLLIVGLQTTRAEVGTESVNFCLENTEKAFLEAKDQYLILGQLSGSQLCRLVEAQYRAKELCFVSKATLSLTPSNDPAAVFQAAVQEIESLTPEDARKEIAAIEARWKQMSFPEQRQLGQRIRALNRCYLQGPHIKSNKSWRAQFR